MNKHFLQGLGLFTFFYQIMKFVNDTIYFISNEKELNDHRMMEISF